MPLPIAGIGSMMLVSQMGAASTAAATTTGFSTAATTGIAGATAVGCLIIREGVVRLRDRFGAGDEPEAHHNGPESPQNAPEGAPQIAGSTVEEELEISEKVAQSSTQGLEKTVKQEPEVLEKVTESEVQSLKNKAESKTQMLGKTVERESTQPLEGMDGENNDRVKVLSKQSDSNIEFLAEDLKSTKAENKKEFDRLANMNADILAQLAGLAAQMNSIQQGSSRSSDRSSRRSNSSSSNSHRSLRGNNAQVASPDLNNAPPIESTLSLYSQNPYHMPEPSFCRVSTWANQQAIEELEQDRYPETIASEANPNTIEESDLEYVEYHYPEGRGSRIRGHAPFNPNNERGVSSSSSQSSYGTLSISQNSFA